ncbi:MAG: hypothetical protein ACK4NF_00235 [Planctomycetota bacterium]
MNKIKPYLTELKIFAFNTLLKNSFTPLIKNPYFDNTFSSITFKEMFINTLLEQGLQDIDLGFENKLLRSFTNE